MKIRLALLAALALAAPASAQQITTHCDSLSRGQVTCRTNVPEPRQSSWDSVARGQALVQDIYRRDAERRVSQLVLSGQCNEARDQALRAGEFAMAEQAYALCRQRQGR